MTPDALAMKSGPELCEPCQWNKWREIEAVAQQGWDFTYVCDYHQSHSWSHPPVVDNPKPNDAVVD